MRVSKEPEIRREEIARAAMEIFGERNYEDVSMADIAGRVQVVPGLCYRYFSSKQELYRYALGLYAAECSAPFVGILEEAESLEDCFGRMRAYMERHLDQEAYHDFFHKKGNQVFHHQLDCAMAERLLPALLGMMERLGIMKGAGEERKRCAAMMALYGQMPILREEGLSAGERMDILEELLRRVLLG